jgi:hypothetical protein
MPATVMLTLMVLLPAAPGKSTWTMPTVWAPLASSSALLVPAPSLLVLLLVLVLKRVLKRLLLLVLLLLVPALSLLVLLLVLALKWVLLLVLVLTPVLRGVRRPPTVPEADLPAHRLLPVWQTTLLRRSLRLRALAPRGR